MTSSPLGITESNPHHGGVLAGLTCLDVQWQWHHSDLTVSLTGTCVPQGSVGSQRKYESHCQEGGSVRLYVRLRVHREQKERVSAPRHRELNEVQRCCLRLKEYLRMGGVRGERWFILDYKHEEQKAVFCWISPKQLYNQKTLHFSLSKKFGECPDCISRKTLGLLKCCFTFGITPTLSFLFHVLSTCLWCPTLYPPAECIYVLSHLCAHIPLYN